MLESTLLHHQHLGWNRQGHCCGPVSYLTGWQLNDIVIFWKLLLGLLEDVPPALKQRMCYRHNRATARDEKDIGQWLNANIPRKGLDIKGSLHGLLSHEISLWWIFSCWEHLKEHDYAVPPRTIEDFMARLEAAVTTVETDMLPHFREQAKPSALKSMEATLNIYQNYKAPIVLSSNSLWWHISWKPNVMGHTLYNIFWLVF
jgi:hypothetical protein